jgi:hypothetical protein
MNEKTFRCMEADGYRGKGPRIFVDAYSVPQSVHDELDALSSFHGEINGNKFTYKYCELEYMWEFPLDGKNYAKAVVFLRTSGWLVVR